MHTPLMLRTVKPVLEITSIQRPPPFKDHVPTVAFTSILNSTFSIQRPIFFGPLNAQNIEALLQWNVSKLGVAGGGGGGDEELYEL